MPRHQRTFAVEVIGIFAWPWKTRLENNFQDCPGAAFAFLEQLLKRANVIPTKIGGCDQSLFLRFNYEHRKAVHEHLRTLFNQLDADFCYSSLGLCLERKTPVAVRPFLVKAATANGTTEVMARAER